MKGRGVEVGLAVEAACQKFFKSTATYRMERGLCVKTHQSLVGSGLQNLCHQTR